MELCQCMGAEVHQWRRTEIFRVADHSEVGHEDAGKDPGGDPGGLRGRAEQAERKRQVRTTAPGIVDADRNPILERSEVYSGVYGRASINFYAFNSNGNKGIACGLNNLQKIRDGEPLGGKSRAEDDFAEEDEEDFLS